MRSRNESPPPIVRAFRASDQAATRALIEEGLGEHFGFIDRNANPDLVDIAETYAQPHAFFVAELDGTIVGTAGVLVAKDIARMVRVGVARAHRRRGIAGDLLDTVIAFAAANAIRDVVAYTQPEWVDATKFYEAHGFAPYGHDDVDIYLRKRI